MKRVLIITVFLSFFAFLNAQYKTFNFGGVNYEVNCFYNKDGYPSVRIKLQSMDMFPIEIAIGSKPVYEGFVNRLSVLKDKYEEWDSLCISNKISDVKKLIPYTASTKERIVMFFGKNFNVQNATSMYIRIDDKSKACIYTGSIKHVTNEYIKTDGGYIAFDNAEEIEEMIDALRMENITNYIEKEIAKSELLK